MNPINRRPVEGPVVLRPAPARGSSRTACQYSGGISSPGPGVHTGGAFLPTVASGELGRFVKAARSYAKTCSSGEPRLLLAVCAAVDFAYLADDLAGGRAWQDITAGCDLRYRAAIAARVLATHNSTQRPLR